MIMTKVYENIKNTADGWSISGNTGNINSNNDIISQSNGMLRFYTDKYWNQFWLDKDITSAVKMKYTKDGLSDSTAEVNIAKKLEEILLFLLKQVFSKVIMTTETTMNIL